MKVKEEFWSNFFKLVKGTAIGQLIPILISPIISRLYSPSEIGLFALYSSLAAIAINIICLKFDQAIMLPARRGEFKRLLSLALKVTNYLSIAVLVFLIAAKFLAYIGTVKDFANWWFLFAFHLYYLGTYQTSMFLLNREKQYSSISNSKIYNGTIYALFQIFLFKLNEVGLVLSLFLSRALSAIYLKNRVKKLKLIENGRRDKKIIFSNIEKSLIKKYKDFPLYSAPNALLNSTSNQLPILLLSYCYSSQVAGIYSWANRIIQIPMSFIISSVQQVFFQEASSRVMEGKGIYILVNKTYKRLFLIGIIPYLLVFLFAPQMFSLVFGEEWREAGYYTRYLIPWLFVVFLNSPITSIIPILGKQKSYLFNEIFLIVSRSLALLIGYFYFGSPEISVFLFGLVGVLYNIYLFYYLKDTCRKWERSTNF